VEGVGMLEAWRRLEEGIVLFFLFLSGQAASYTQHLSFFY
jgi:hypothetical protein